MEPRFLSELPLSSLDLPHLSPQCCRAGELTDDPSCACALLEITRRAPSAEGGGQLLSRRPASLCPLHLNSGPALATCQMSLRHLSSRCPDCLFNPLPVGKLYRPLPRGIPVLWCPPGFCLCAGSREKGCDGTMNSLLSLMSVRRQNGFRTQAWEIPVPHSKWEGKGHDYGLC